MFVTLFFVGNVRVKTSHGAHTLACQEMARHVTNIWLYIVEMIENFLVITDPSSFLLPFLYLLVVFHWHSAQPTPYSIVVTLQDMGSKTSVSHRLYFSFLISLMNNAILILRYDLWMTRFKSAQRILQIMQLRVKFASQLGFRMFYLFFIHNINTPTSFFMSLSQEWQLWGSPVAGFLACSIILWCGYNRVQHHHYQAKQGLIVHVVSFLLILQLRRIIC